MARSLENYGYRLTQPAATRRRILGKAAKRLGYKTVYRRLNQREQKKGYKGRRARADRNWIHRKMKKLGLRTR
jgi:hypothetical protein